MRHRYAALVVFAFTALALFGCEGGGGRFKLDPSLKREVKTFGGYQFVPLSRACDVYGIQCDWDTYTRTATLRKGPYSVVAMAGSDRILVNRDAKRLPHAVVFDAGTVYVPVTLIGKNLVLSIDPAPAARSDTPRAGVKGCAEPVRASAAPAPQPAVRAASLPQKIAIETVVIDAGHGGKDVGAVGRHHGLREKEHALRIADRVRDILEENGLKVVMTRDDDTFVPLPARAALSNKIGADLFVSIHINSSRSRFMRGFECYYLSAATDDSARALEALENSALKLGGDADVERSTGLDKTLWDLTLTENRIESAALAEHICRSVVGAVPLANRGVKTANFYVLKHTNMPSVLVEACYLSNRDDETKLKSAPFQDRVADAVAQGILLYKREFETTEGFTRI